MGLAVLCLVGRAVGRYDMPKDLDMLVDKGLFSQLGGPLAQIIQVLFHLPPSQA